MSIFIPLQEALQPYLSKTEIEKIHAAYLYAAKAHQGQTRSNGQPYIIHPMAVAVTLAQLKLDPATIKAALLHDVIEDTPIEKKDVEKKFGKEVTKLVDGMTKLTKIEFESHAHAQAENFRKMMMAMAADIRVILIKLADRLHNMQTLCHLDISKRKRIAKETLDIYAPIAHRLGMNTFRHEFEDLGFSSLYPLRYKVLSEIVKKARGHRIEIIHALESGILKTLEKAQLSSFELKGREKSLYSIYKKMKQKHLKFSEIMDVYAFRIIVSSIDECYRALGLVHSLYKPLPERFNDYIAIPKANGYQSLHTTLFGPYGVPIEVQIRTKSMDKIAENGIAAHWLYKTDDIVVDQAQLRAREWIKGLLEIQQNAGSSLEFIENVKIDLFPDEVYVFTPRGQIQKLPSGATAVDFAYAVHTDIGNSCVAAKIDRRLASLSTQLKNGQTVEIVTAPDAHPNPSWLNFVVTGKARGEIRYALKQQRKDESAAFGKQLLERALKMLGENLKNISKKQIKKVLDASGYSSPDALYENIGLGNQIAQIIARRLVNQENYQLAESHQEHEMEPFHIRGTEGLVVNFAKCCRPIPNDPIVGVLTTGHGIVVHHAECNNVLEARRQPDKVIPLQWSEEVTGHFEVELEIEVANKPGVFASIASAIAHAEANIENIDIHKPMDAIERCVQIRLLLSVRNRDHLAHIIRCIRQISTVSAVTRVRNV
ncbi:MAG: RelA/SpoT family protein [Gammaproteobacteria bacterium]|nr:RelA/SpoT family protein [Gammaproteobacteria bacterium]MBU2546442.1 RelA/SpoT family protein [Gammaproteobacteria bacterium]